MGKMVYENGGKFPVISPSARSLATAPLARAYAA